MNLRRSVLKIASKLNVIPFIKAIQLLRANASLLKICSYYIRARNAIINNYLSEPTLTALQFDTTVLDRYILKSAQSLTSGLLDRQSPELDPMRICILATRTYESGGHTECILRLMSFLADFELFFIECDSLYDDHTQGPDKLRKMANRAEIHLIHHQKDLGQTVAELYKTILETRARNLITFIHPHDAVSTAVLGLLKANTAVHVIYNVHADHLLNLGLSFGDAVLVGRQASQEALAQHLKRPPIIVSVSPSYDRTFIFDDNDIEEEKQRLGLDSDNYVTLTGCPAYKIFRDTNLPYWRLIKRLLIAEPKLKHLFISSLTVDQRRSLNSLFDDAPELLERVVFLEPGPRFPLYINASDLFIDSFPLGSALTHIDVIREKRPTVIKINDDPFLSFQDYLYDKYKFNCHTVDEMFDSIIYLLHNPEVRAKIGWEVFQFSKERYSFTRLKNEVLSYLELN
ncbi:MAG: hypothetical protein LBT47_02685 [Deltaproteobacteria bacterium]|jgi:hypothetical protein|nr:hypothetical protein [Deltaproteobacteria bacterium]